MILSIFKNCMTKKMIKEIKIPLGPKTLHFSACQSETEIDLGWIYRLLGNQKN